MKTLGSYCRNKTFKERLEKLKIKPASFIFGVFFGLVDGEFDQQEG